MKYYVCVLFLAGAAVAQWGADDGQWRDDTHQWNQWSGDDNGQWHGDNAGQWNGDQGGQWNPAADGSLAGQWNPAANNWVGAPVAPWAGAPWGVPGVPHDTPEVAAAKAAHLAAHAAASHRWRRQAILPGTALVSPLVASPLWSGATHHTIVAPNFVTTHATTHW